MGDPVLYGLAHSVYTRIVRLVCAEKLVSYDFKEVDVFTEKGVPSSYLKRQPFGRIPSLTDGHFVLYETTAITRYIDEAYQGPPLQPDDVVLRARMNQIISVLDSYAYRPMIWDVFVERIVKPSEHEQSNEKKIAQALPMIATCLQELTKWLGSENFLSGKQLSLADLHATPMLVYLVQTSEGEELLSAHSKLLDWMNTMQRRDSFQQTRSTYG